MDLTILIATVVSVALSQVALIIATCLLSKTKSNGKALEEIAYLIKGNAISQPEKPALSQAKEIAVTKQPEVEEAVTFSADKSKTLDDKFNELDKTRKGYYTEIANYAASVEGAKRFKNLRYEEYKIGSMRIVRMLVKRDVIFCEFMLQDSSFRTYAAQNKVSVKQAATVIKVIDQAAVKVVKDTIDIAVKGIEQAKEIKKQIAREKRKEKRKATAE